MEYCGNCGLPKEPNHDCLQPQTKSRDQLFPQGENKFNSDKLFAQVKALTPPTFEEIRDKVKLDISQGRTLAEQLTKKCAEPNCPTMLARGARRYCSQHYKAPDKTYQMSTRGGFRYEIRETGSVNVVVVYYRTRVVFQHVIKATEDRLDKFDLVKEGKILV
jgi:hypothetical protein